MKYPYNVDIHEPKQEQNKFYAYSNYVLSVIPKGEWVTKVDADHIYESQKLYKSFYLLQKPYDSMGWGILDFDIQDGKAYIKNARIREDYDHVTAQSDMITFKEVFAPWNGIDSKKGYFEVLKHKRRYRRTYTELTQWHFPYFKDFRKSVSKNQKWIPPEEWHSDDIGVRIDHKMLDSGRILDLCKDFE